MAEREPVEVTVEIDGRETVAGTLWIHERGGQSATFRYSDSYLAAPAGYALDPALPKSAGVFRLAARGGGGRPGRFKFSYELHVEASRPPGSCTVET